MKREPTAEQIEALRAFAARYGPQWKSKLNLLWANGGDEREPDAPLLRQVRNQLGPSWLKKWRMNP